MQGMDKYLQQMVERSSAILVGRDGKLPFDGLLFLGNPQMVFPRLLFEDPVLEPVDCAVWAAIKLAAADGDSVTAFPTYEELMRRTKVGSKVTISRSLSILRSTRWLTVCKTRLRDANGRVKGNIYALHDEPLQLAETLALNDGYIDWLEGTADSKHTRHPRAVAIAKVVLREMREQLWAGVDVTAMEQTLPRQAMGLATAARIAAGQAPEEGFFTLTASSITEITQKSYQKARAQHKVQKLDLTKTTPNPLSTETGLSGSTSENAEKPDGDSEKLAGMDASGVGESRNWTDVGVSPVSGLGGKGGSSSINIYKNTTTYPVVTTEVVGSTETGLTWPVGLARADTSLVRQHLARIPAKHHQPVLDALAAKLAAIAGGKSQPIHLGIPNYVRKLCELAVTGKLNPVPTIVPAPPDNPDTPSTPEAVDRAVKALACELSNASAEAKRLRQLAERDSHLTGAALEAEKQWKAISQRYTELKQMQGRVLH